jgi:hypothetical protein
MLPMPARLDDLIAAVGAHEPPGDALSDVSTAVVVAGQLGELADQLIGHFVDQARRAGASWTEIGRAMGVTKQAAQQRFVPRADLGPSFGTGTFGRFTARSRRSIVAAEAEARQAGSAQVDGAHVVLGLLSERDALAARALEAQGVDLDALRADVTALLPPPGGPLPDHIPFSPAAKTTLELTLGEALRLGHNYIGTEHMLLAVLDGDGPARAALVGRGVDRDQAEAWLMDQLRR